jgi:uncharacterized membrane protein YfhO
VFLYYRSGGDVAMRQHKINNKTTNDKTIPFSDLFDKTLDKYSGWIIAGIVTALVFFIFKNFISGKFYYLFSDVAMDTLKLNFPNIYHVTKYLRIDGFPLWSFSQGMGQNIMASSFSDSFSLIVYLSGPSNAAYSIIWMEIAKVLLTAMVFYHFLKLLNLSNMSTMIGIVLYCFGGFMFIGGQWWGFSTEACFVAILLLSFEKLYCQDSWYLFPLAVALLAIFNPFSLYTSSMFLFIYFLFRHFSSDNPGKKLFIPHLLKMCGLGFLGILISSFILAGNIQNIIESPRVTGNFSYFHILKSIPIFTFENPEHYVTALLRFFSNDLMGNAVAYSGWHNYLEAPLFYIGLLPLLLLPQLFVLFKNRRLIVYTSFLFVLIMPVIFPFFRYAFFLFSGDYYRVYSLFVSLSILILGLYTLDEIQRKNTINIYILLGTFLVFIAILFFPYKTNITNMNIAGGEIYKFRQAEGVVSINSNLCIVISIFLFIYATLLCLLKYVHYKPLLMVLLLAFVITEIAYMNASSFNNRYPLSSLDMTKYFKGITKDAVDYIKFIDKGFYRINIDTNILDEIDRNRGLFYNKSKIQDYFGTTSYDRFNQKYYIRFMEEMGVIKKGKELESRQCSGLMLRPLLWSFASIKYHIGKTSDATLMLFGFKPIKEIGSATVYQNGNFLPLGYTYEQYVTNNKFQSLSEGQKQLVLQKAIVLNEPVIPEIASKIKEFDLNKLPANYGSQDYLHDIANLNQNTFNMNYFSQNHINGTIKLNTPKILFFSIPYDKGWTADVDNRMIKPQLCNIGFQGILLQPGYHTIKLSYVPPYFFVSFIMSAIGLFLYLAIIIFHVKFAQKYSALTTRSRNL